MRVKVPKALRVTVVLKEPKEPLDLRVHKAHRVPPQIRD